MSRGYNFSAGPAALPEDVLRQAQAELAEWNGARASVMEISHRGKDFVALASYTVCVTKKRQPASIFWSKRRCSSPRRA